MSINQRSSISPQAVIELISQMTTYEKEELSKLLDLKSMEKPINPKMVAVAAIPNFI